MKTTHTGRLLTIYRMVLGLNVRVCLLTPTFGCAPNWHSFNEREREREKILRGKKATKRGSDAFMFFDDSISMLRWKTLDTTVCVKAIRQHHKKKKKKTLFLNLFWFDIYFSQVSIDIDVPRDFESLFISYVDGKKNTGERLQSRTKSGEEDKNRGEPD